MPSDKPILNTDPAKLPEKRKRNIFIDLRKLLSDINIRATRAAFQAANFIEGINGWRLSANGLIEGTRMRLDNFIGRDDSTIIYYGHSAATSTRARAANVATIVTATPHDLTTGNMITVFDVGGTGYNLSSVVVTVINATTFTYASPGGNEGTTATDVGGTFYTWSDEKVNTFYGGKSKISNTIDDFFTIDFNGPSIGVVMEKSNASGKVEFSLDGGAPTTVDLYSATTFTRSIVYSANDLASIAHTLVATIVAPNGASLSPSAVRMQGYVKSPTDGIKIDAISADIIAIAVQGTTDGTNGYVKLTTPAVPTGYSSWHITGMILDPAVMNDATSDPKLVTALNAVYLYNGQVSTTYAVLIEFMVSKI